MEDGVKRPTRARRTRRRIIDAAAALFVAEGYGATTLEQIAARAGVAVQTIYFHFGNKRTLLKEAVDVASVGDDEPVPLLERPWVQALRVEPDPHRVLEGWIAGSREISERVAGILGVVRDAAVVDPEMAEQWAVNEEQRATAFRVLVDLLAERDALRPGLDVDEATDIVFAVLSVDVYLLLTTRRGWSSQRWQRWTTETLRASLLA